MNDSAGNPALAWRALIAWRRAAGPFGRFVFASPFLGADFGLGTGGTGAGRTELAGTGARSARPPATNNRAVQRLKPALGDGLTEKQAYLIDLDPNQTLGALPYLRSLSGRIIPLIARWDIEPAVVPSRRVCGLLRRLAPGPIARRTATGPPIFLLDGARAGGVSEPAQRTLAARFDNRYRYQIDYLPPAPFLLEAGIDRIVWVSATGGAAPDLLEYETRLIRAGLALDHRQA